MAEVINMPADSLEGRNDTNDNSKKSADGPESSLASPLKRRADREIRGRRDERELDRAPVRHGTGDYHDRSRSSPPPASSDKDFKRRASPSPPLPFRDRRHSPPRRSPPFPPFKRSRRDDTGYDRRGSPRGGYGPGDRRFGYDQYEREMGGRLGYGGDERHGRFGRPSDWEQGRGYGDASNTGNTQRDGLMTYKQFIQELEDDILPSEAEHRYQEYKSEYILTMKRAYFEAHKDQEWLKDKYHPTNLVAVIERRSELARKTASDFLLDLQSGTLVLGPGVNSSSEHTGVPNSDDEVDVGGKRRRQGSAPSKEADVVSGAPKAHPVSSEPRRIQIDIEQAQALVRKLDSEKVIEENILGRVDNGRSNREKSASGPVIIVRGLTSVKGLEGTELLDTLITYLWRVHGVDYYGLVESCEPPKGLRHVRFDGKSSDDTLNGGAEWEKKLDTYWQDRLKGQDPLEIRAAKEKLDAIAVEALDPHVRKIRDEKYGWKYGCGAKGCTKLFHAAEFVHKHLKLKHPELATEMTAKAREELYFQNYMNDADAPGGTPVMQKERQQRRKLGLDQRLKDERGNNRRDWDNRDDRSDNKAQSLDFQSKNNGMVGDSPDEIMFETYGGHGAPPFPSDIPPPVLMPVPGAGPLGPFIPAPPGVAMRMLRDQGGRPPFEGGGRNGRSGPSPIIALPPAFHQDPRRIRSYQDLDAPEDEVTVIDYRSL